MRYCFHANVFARPDRVERGDAVLLRDLELPTLRAARDAYLPVTFEQALVALTKLPRTDAEPDGYFVVSGDADGRRWQVDGHLFDFGGRLHRVELHGECPRETFDAILGCFGWPGTPLLFELTLEGVAMDEGAFREWCEPGRPRSRRA